MIKFIISLLWPEPVKADISKDRFRRALAGSDRKEALEWDAR